MNIYWILCAILFIVGAILLIAGLVKNNKGMATGGGVMAGVIFLIVLIIKMNDVDNEPVYPTKYKSLNH